MFSKQTTGLGIALAVAALSAAAGAQTKLLTYKGAASHSGFGWQPRGLGDLDGDGFPEFVTFGGEDTAVNPNSGSIRVLGARTGALLFEENGAAGDTYGCDIAAAGDVNGDGIGDFIVGGMQYTNWLTTGLGFARVRSGKDFSLIHQVDGLNLNEGFGAIVSGAGDTDADGYDDFLVGSYWTSTASAAYCGSFTLYSGQSGKPLVTMTGTEYLHYFGEGLAGAGDLNGDGYGDFYVGAPGEDQPLGAGAMYAYSGRTYSQLWKFEEPHGWGIGSTIVPTPDCDGDLVPDVLVSAPTEGSGGQFGLVFLLSGASGTVLHVFSGATADDLFGYDVASTGDMDGDGRSDIAIAAPFADDGGANTGSVYVYSGVTYSLLATISGSSSLAPYGAGVGAIGDPNQDGVNELLVTGENDGTPGEDKAELWTLAECHASWKNYGRGWKGTLGIPAFTLSAPPVLGTTVVFTIGNSLGAPTAGLLFVGFSKASIPTSKDGTILVTPTLLTPFGFGSGDRSFGGGIPNDVMLCGFEVDLQAIELDPGASKGVAFTPGLELILGGPDT